MTENTPPLRLDQRRRLAISIDDDGRVDMAVRFSPDEASPEFQARLFTLCQEVARFAKPSDASLGSKGELPDEPIADACAREFDLRKRQNRRLGRAASRWLRYHGSRFSSAREARRAFGTDYGMSAEDIEILVRLHNRQRDARYRQMRDHVIARLHSEEGWNFAEIGERFGVSNKTASKWVREAFSNIRKQAISRRSDIGKKAPGQG